LFGFFSRGKGDGDLFTPRMPAVDEPQNMDEVFQKARRSAAGELRPEGLNPQDRFLIVVTPGRMIMHHLCPAAGTMPTAQVEAIEKMLPSKVKRNIAAIAYTGLEAVRTSIEKTIPFAGFLLAFAYIGHAVWVFEGHSSALAVGCRDADLLLVDGGMVPFLKPDWTKVAFASMRNPEIYIHDRATYALKKVMVPHPPPPADLKGQPPTS